MLARHAADTRALIKDGEVIGTRVLRVPHAAGGHVDLQFPKSWFHAHKPEPGEHYGTTAFDRGVFPVGGQVLPGRSNRRATAVHAQGCLWRGGYVLPRRDDLVNGVETPNRDLAMQIVEQIQAGGVTVRPAVYDDKGNERWTLKRATVPSSPTHILDYPKDLDTEIYHGLEIPDDVIESGSTGAWAGKRIPMAAFYAGLDGWVASIINDIVTQIIEHLVLLNFGTAEEFEVTHQPLADQAMEQQEKAEQQQQPQGQTGQQPQQQADGDPLSQYRMSLDAEAAVGQGVLTAAELVQATQSVIRMRTGERWLTIGGSKKDDKDHAGGFPVKIDADGNILAGGPKGMKGRHISKVGDYFKKVRNSPSARKNRIESKVKKQAQAWGMSPEDYQQVVEQVWKEKIAEHRAREEAKGYARKSLGVDAGNIRKLEDQGFDHASGKIKGLDTLGREMASLYPDLGWGGGYDSDSGVDDTDYDAKVWDLLKEGKTDLPSKDSAEFHEAVDEYLSYVMDQSGGDWEPNEDDGPPVPFALRRLANDGPQEGDRKPGADGELVFSKGHWRKDDKETLTFVSPSRVPNNKNLSRAIRAISGPRHQRMKREFSQIDQSIGLAPRAWDVVGEWGGTIENTILSEYRDYRDLAELEYVTACKGLLAQQKGIYLFDVGGDGESILYTLNLPAPMADVYNALADVGIADKTITAAGKTTQLWIIDDANRLADAVANISERFHVKANQSNGRAIYRGGGPKDRFDSIQPIYEEIFKKYASQFPERPLYERFHQRLAQDVESNQDSNAGGSISIAIGRKDSANA